MGKDVQMLMERPPLSDLELDKLFGALADPTRRAVLVRLAQRDAGVLEVAAPFPISQPARHERSDRRLDEWLTLLTAGRSEAQ